jgi:hypothetical protein
MLLVIEMDDYNSAGYGMIHRAGCKHVKDPMTMRSAKTLEQLTEAFNDTTGWGFDEIEVRANLSPCARTYNQE